MKYKNILWDWNGTILNDTPVAFEATNILLERYNYPTITLEFYRDNMDTPIVNFYSKIFNLNKHDMQMLDETVVLLSKGNISSEKIRVEFNLEDMDMSGFRQGATYEEIQEWVQEKYGFHVTHLNIAQVKRKHGIVERKNYNKPKTPDYRQPGCPDDKVKAIEDALKHFQMI
jgi:phosphoglycolate phosphatase-like HAD superfamily hydrolase